MKDPSRELKLAKRAIRSEVRSRRDEMPPEERGRASDLIRERSLREIERLDHAGTVMVYWSFGSEVTTEGLIEALIRSGRKVAMPRVTDGELEPRAYRPGDAVSETTFGAKEPVGGEVLHPDDIDVIVVPGLAFDRRGYRVGYGGGFYDRLLSRTRPDAVRMGFCFAIQVVERVPSGSFDLPVDMIVTESETIRCRPGTPAIARENT